MSAKLDRICVFCGSSDGGRPGYLEAARTLGRTLAARDIGVVYGGARIGLMGAVADAALEAGGRAYGALPRFLAEKEIAHEGLTELYIVSSMHERKAKMADLADGFIALPGGAGTLEELFEIFTWGQLGMHAKPVAVLNVEGFYDALLAFLDHTVTEGFLKSLHRGMILTGDDPDALIDAMHAYRAPSVDKLLDRSTT